MASTAFPSDSELAQKLTASVQFYWKTRKLQARKRAGRGKDPGSRGAVVGGRQMEKLEELVAELTERAGIGKFCIFRDNKLELPGYYRAEKQWDIVVVAKDTLVCAIELKSQVGPSFGNNFNNRTEEALGNASDLWTAVREERFGDAKPRPFLGYFFLLEDCSKVHSPVKVQEPHFRVDEVFRKATYSNRYEILLRRLVSERLYDAACLTLATKSTSTKVSHPAKDLDFHQFAFSFYANAQKFARLLA